MSLLHVSNLSYRHPVQPDWLIRDACFDLNPGDRVALVGPNGCGKTTLLRLLTGELNAPTGTIVRRSHLTIAHARQSTPDRSVPLVDHALGSIPRIAQLNAQMRSHEEQLDDPAAAVRYAHAVVQYGDVGGYAHEARVAQVLAGLGFSEEEQRLRLAELSGGQRTRAELARVLLTPADLALLDEPTNHLDLAARDWLERFLGTLDSAVLVVSHDRRFLQSTARRILELRRGRLTTYTGGYEWYREQLALADRQAWQSYEAQQRRQRAAQQAAAKRMQLAAAVAATPKGVRHSKDFFAAKAARVQRAAKVIQARAAREPKASRPFVEAAVLAPAFATTSSPLSTVLVVDELSMSFQHKALFARLSFVVGPDDRIAIAGSNGAGKSTLLKIILGQIAPTSGSVRLAADVRVGYFAQDADDLDPYATALDLCSADALGGLRFPMDRASAPIAALSAGERAKVGVARLLAHDPNFLILDEPTNHLDLDTQEALEESLAAFRGPLLLVSHDRQLVERLTSTSVTL